MGTYFLKMGRNNDYKWWYTGCKRKNYPKKVLKNLLIKNKVGGLFYVELKAKTKRERLTRNKVIVAQKKSLENLDLGTYIREKLILSFSEIQMTVVIWNSEHSNKYLLESFQIWTGGRSNIYFDVISFSIYIWKKKRKIRN